jgi:hypothetical protein
MTEYSVTVMHPGGTIYNYTVKAKRWYLDGNCIIFVKEGDQIEIYPQTLTIIYEEK